MKLDLTKDKDVVIYMNQSKNELDFADRIQAVRDANNGLPHNILVAINLVKNTKSIFGYEEK